MSGIEFAIIDCGHMENDKELNQAASRFGSYINQNPASEWLRSPILSVLVKHPSAGNILFDLGTHPGNASGRLPDEMKEMFYLDVAREDCIDKRLEAIGMSVDDIDAIILSHGHFDRIGGLCFFDGKKAGANVYISHAEFEAALLCTHINGKGYDHAYMKDDYEYKNIKFHLLERQDTEPFPGLELISLPGYTHGTIGMVLHCECGTYIFPFGTLGIFENYLSLPSFPPAQYPGLCVDTLGFFDSVKKIKALEKEYDATIIYSHEIRQMDDLKTAPYFYK
jgi:glyoxylase-like metal-dependent hydrolase (beta-lactamase superfamily II)